MLEYLDVAASAASSNAGILIACAIIVLAAFALYFAYFWRRARRIEAPLRRATARLKAVDNRQAFLQNFEAINAELEEDLILGRPWVRYRESFVEPSESESPASLKSSTEPDLHFNTETVIDPVLNTRFLAAIPNFLTGAGILGTFVGLVAGIYLASSGLDNPDIAIVKASLQKLLKGASLAFSTSIAGLLSSIVFSVAEKRRLHRLGITLGEWNRRIESLVERVTPEQLAASQVSETKRQTKQLERFGTELAVSLADSLQDRLTVHFGPALERLVSATEALATNQARAQEELLRELVRELQTSFREGAGKEMSSLQASLGDLTKGLNVAVAGFEKVQGQISSASSAMASALAESVERSVKSLSRETETFGASLTKILDDANAMLATSLQSSGKAAASAIETASNEAAATIGTSTNAASALLSGAFTGLDRASEKLREVIDSASTLLRTNADAARAMDGAAERLESALRGFEVAAGPVSKVLQEVQESASAISGSVQAIAGATDALRDTAARMESVAEASSDAWRSYSERFGEVDSALARVFSQLQGAQEAHLELIQEYVKQLDKELGKSVSALSSVAGELREAIGDLEEAVEKMR